MSTIAAVVARSRYGKILAVLFGFTGLIVLGVLQVRESAVVTGGKHASLLQLQLFPGGQSTAINITSKCRTWLEWVESYRRCVTKYLDAKKDKGDGVAWYFMHEALSTCSGQATFDMLNVHYLSNKDDVKLVVLPSNVNRYRPEDVVDAVACTEVTLGVGNDTESEKKLLELLPGCRMHGADPFEKAGSIFKTIGTYYEIAVGGRSGVFKANVLVGPGIYNYAVKEVPTLAFTEFLIDRVKETKIDYLFMDNEGAEYDVLPMFYRKGAVENSKLSICQISVELHGPLASYNMSKTKYDNLMRDLLINSSLIPLWSSAPQNHARMYLFNAEDKYCMEKYLQKWCFQMA